MRTIALTLAALVAFAANSILCRIALGNGAIDAASFSTIRLTSGAAVLWMLSASRRPAASLTTPAWTSAFWLLLYAVSFSFAYLRLTTAVGALILFGFVQLTMLAASLRSGAQPPPLQYLGIAAAGVGLVYLMWPGLAAPDLLGAGLMALAGVAWGVYSLRGRSTDNPLAHTTLNFARAVPFAMAINLSMMGRTHVESAGAWLAIASGSVTSGVGYVIWYAALKGLTRLRAAVVQLVVPVLAALGGVLFLSEAVSMRLVVSASLVLGGVGVALLAPDRRDVRRPRQPRREIE